jgi:hypothetical protein
MIMMTRSGFDRSRECAGTGVSTRPAGRRRVDATSTTAMMIDLQGLSGDDLPEPEQHDHRRDRKTGHGDGGAEAGGERRVRVRRLGRCVVGAV